MMVGAVAVANSEAVKDDLRAGSGTSIRSETSVVTSYWRVEPLLVEGQAPDINFKVVDPRAPLEQRVLKGEIERALSIINVLYGNVDQKSKLLGAFNKLLALAQVGLVGEHASPAIASDALRALEADITNREAGPIKNAYMRKLGLIAGGIGGVSAIAYIICDQFPWFPLKQVYQHRTIFLLWSGCMAGAWASFATRKVTLGFSDLVALEEDRIEPALRLLFSGVLTSILALVFINGLADVAIGGFRASDILASGSAALLIGAFAGLAEKALPTAVMSRADQLISSTAAPSTSV